MFFVPRFYILPRFLRKVQERSMKCTFLGIDLQLPLGLSPVGLQGLVNEVGEVASARGNRIICDQNLIIYYLKKLDSIV